MQASQGATNFVGLLVSRALPSESRWPPVKPNETLRFRSPSFLHAVSNPWESVEACDYFAAGQVVPTDKESTLPARFRVG